MSRLSDLKDESLRILSSDNEGSYKKRKYRKQVIERVLHALAYTSDIPANWKGLKKKNIQDIIKYWNAQGVNDKSIRMYLADIRYFLNLLNINIDGISNKELGLKRCEKQTGKEINVNDIYKIDDKVSRTILELQIYFGLTLSESFRINPDIHFREDFVLITREISTNNNDRSLDIYNSNQKQLINSLSSLTGFNQSLISKYGYHGTRERYRYSMKSINLKPRVSYRSIYAKNRYKYLINEGKTVDIIKDIIMDEMGISHDALKRHLNE